MPQPYISFHNKSHWRITFPKFPSLVLKEKPVHLSPSTFQEYPKDVSEDGDGGAEDEDREQKRTDGICDFILGLKER